ncbi:MAG: hypothetical protein ACT4N2_09430 [Hyphomicrobium sp.]
MTDNRNIASDATFFVLYVGFAGAMVTLSIALLLWSMYDSFSAAHSYAAAANVLGWIALPFVPGLYRSYTGRNFSLKQSDALNV